MDFCVRTETVMAAEQAEMETAGENTVTASEGMWLFKDSFLCVNWSTLVLPQKILLYCEERLSEAAC